MATKRKQPYEVLDFDIDFTKRMPDGDSLVAVQATVQGIDESLTVERTTFDGPIAKVYLAGGTSSVTYKVTVMVVTADGRALEYEFNIFVKDT